MKKIFPAVFILAVLMGAVEIFAASYHPLKEIHYLKSFHPDRFTAEEAFHASAVELIKIHITIFPFLVVTVLSVYFLNCFGGKDSWHRNP